MKSLIDSGNFVWYHYNSLRAIRLKTLTSQPGFAPSRRMAAMMMLLSVLLMAGVTPLTETQRQQLATARDLQGDWDEGALYPLLRNVMTWTDGDASGATVPNYDALHRAPASQRGKLFLIEGELGDVQPIRRRLAQPGDFETNLQQWSIRVADDPDEVVVCLMVDPMPWASVPPIGTDVRLAGRFYKVWQFHDRSRVAAPTAYLLFVGTWVQTRGGSLTATTSDKVQPHYVVAGIIFVMLLGALWYTLRRATRISLEPKPLAAQLHRQTALESSPIDDTDELLPEDAAEALDVLRRHHQTDMTKDNR